MIPDIKALQAFYTSPLGKVVAKVLCHSLSMAPLNPAKQSLFIGYCPPALREACCDPAELHLFLAQQGAVKVEGPRGTAALMADDLDLPIASESIYEIKALHSIEFTRDVNAFIQELHRILEPGGVITLIVPNRRGLWARLDNTPFGYGHPYTRTQLFNLLTLHGFEVTLCKRLLFTPPIHSPFLLKYMPRLDSLLKPFMGKFSGLIAMQARKKNIGDIPEAEKAFQFGWCLKGPQPLNN